MRHFERFSCSILWCGVGVLPVLQIDQAALTGESLPVKKFTGDVAFSGSTVKQGERHALVYATGRRLWSGSGTIHTAVLLEIAPCTGWQGVLRHSLSSLEPLPS